MIELMVVIAIIGIVASLTIPWLLDPERRVKKVARELIGDLQHARINAIKQNQNWRIVFNPGNDSYEIHDSEGDTDGDGNHWNEADETRVVKTVRFAGHSEGVIYGDGCGGGPSVTYTANTLTLNPQGTCNAGYVYIKFRNAAYRVGTLSTGVINIHRCTGGDWK